MRRYLLLASVAGCLLNVGNAMAGIAEGAQSATLTASVTLKSAHVLGGTTAFNFGTLLLKRDQIPTDGSVVPVWRDSFGGADTTYVHSYSGDTSRPGLTIDGLHSDEDGFTSLGNINITLACNNFVAGKGCRISAADSKLQAYVAMADMNTASITGNVTSYPFNANLSSLFSSSVEATLKVGATAADWTDLALTNVDAYTVTINY